MKNHDFFTVIILEDETAHAEAISRSLNQSEFKYHIHKVETIAAYKLLMQQHIIPDLVIADIHLPDGSAFDLLQGENPTLPFLVMTSFGDEETAVKAIKSGALDYIVKSPETFKNIEHAINRNIQAWINIRKRIETERQFRTLFETMEQGVVYQNASLHIVSANPAAEKILGFTLEQMQKLNAYNPIWQTIKEDGSVYAADEYPAVVALKTGQPVHDKIIGIYNPRVKGYVWILISAMPQFRDNEPVPYQAYTTFTDITAIKRSEEELKRAKERAEQSDRLKSAFMANMSHEIRTPMNGVLGFSELLKTPGLKEETRMKYIDIIETSGRRMLNIIDDLIDISRIEAGMVEIKNEHTNIRQLLYELLLLFTPESQKKGISLHSKIDLPSREFMIHTDKTKLAQVITNLLKNAIKFTSDRGEIELGCRVDGDSNLIVYVKDNGAGISKEIQEKIFERFHQGEGPSKQEGVGLGLAISKAYVELMGGTIKVESEPGEGSVFSFSIPLQFQAIPLTRQEKEASINLMPCLNVLIAEDDDISYLFLKESLKQKNIKIQRASNGQEAVNMIRNQPEIQIVLMDIRMPEMSGLDAIREIKRIKPNTPIIAQSAFATEKEIHHTFEAGCDDYITKPININVLLDKIAFYTMPA
jgi:signal transduction histidine kinase/AmiR/NasT family two-component response regulator